MKKTKKYCLEIRKNLSVFIMVYILSWVHFECSPWTQYLVATALRRAAAIPFTVRRVSVDNSVVRRVECVDRRVMGHFRLPANDK